jgi:Mor family transcriptional regulator
VKGANGLPTSRARLAPALVLAPRTHPAPAPHSLFDDLVALVGRHCALKLVAEFGGARLYVPHEPGDDALTRAVGRDACARLGRAFGGDRIMIPSSAKGELRVARILELRASGSSIPKIARALQCTQRYVYKVLASNRAAPAAPAHHNGRATSTSANGRSSARTH